MLTKKPYAYILAIVLLIGIMPGVGFADGLEDAAQWYGNLLDVFSWLWVIPAAVAGKLLTNDFVYGEVIGLTSVLRTIRQNMRTFAYITLGVVFIALILKHIFMMDDSSKVFSTIKKTFIAGILIQMSWFLIAALVDLSIVTTSAVAAIPVQIMEKQRNELQYEFKVPKLHINADDGQHDIIASETETTLIELDDVIPRVDTVGGPLVFLAGGVMRIIDARYIEGGEGIDTGGKQKNYSAITIALALKLLLVLGFAIPMILLAIINAIRIFWIWVWIIVSPFLVLDTVFNGPLQQGEYANKFKLSSIFGLVFQPVVVVGLLSLGLIMIIGVFDALLGGEEYKRDSLDVIQTHIEGDAVTTVGGGVTSEATITGELFKDLGGTVGGFVGEMILALFSIFLMIALMKAGASSSAMTSSIVSKAATFMGDAAKSLPVPGVGSIGAMKKSLSSSQNKVRSHIESGYTADADKNLAPWYEKFNIKQDAIRGGASRDDITTAKSILGESIGAKAKTKKFFDHMHSITQNNPLHYAGEIPELMKSRYDKAGKEYLNLGNNVTFDDMQVQGFIDKMMTDGANDMQRSRSSGRLSPLNSNVTRDNRSSTE